ncbi:MAG: MBL fold metallo-hydrolase [Chloroflexota bacterium]
MRVTPDEVERPWHQPGVYQVAPEVYRIPLPIPEDGLRAVNAYVLEQPNTLTVIDPGAGVEIARESLEQGLSALGAGFADIDRSLITHVHYDHYTQAVAQRRRHATPVWLGRSEEASLTVLRDGHRALLGQVTQLRRYGSPALSRAASERRTASPIDDLLRESPDHWITDGESIVAGSHELRALHTPGHTRGHVVFRDVGRTVLYAGDHVLPTITPSIGFEAAISRLPLASYLRSLHAVRSLPDTKLLPAHGAVTPSVHQRIDELLDHHDVRLAAVLDAVRTGASTGFDVAERLRWTRRERRLDELDTFNQMLAVLETGYHLDLLVERSALVVGVEDQVAHYILP